MADTDASAASTTHEPEVTKAGAAQDDGAISTAPPQVGASAASETTEEVEDDADAVSTMKVIASTIHPGFAGAAMLINSRAPQWGYPSMAFGGMNTMKKKKDPNKPKKAATPYTCFVKAKRKAIAEELGGKGPPTDVLKIVAERWKALTDEEKKVGNWNQQTKNAAITSTLSAFIKPRSIICYVAKCIL